MDTNPTPTAPGTPANSSANPGPDDPRSHFAGAVVTANPVIAGVRSEQYDLSTPCPQMRVRDLLEHLVMVLRRVACAGRGTPLADWPGDAADVPEGGWFDAWRTAAHEVQASWPEESLAKQVDVPWGTFSGAEVLGVYTNEVTVHTWDLARATDQQAVWDEAVLTVAWEAIRKQLPMADRTPMWEEARAQIPEGYVWADPFGPAVEVPDGAPLIDRLVGWNGRSPR